MLMSNCSNLSSKSTGSLVVVSAFVFTSPSLRLKSDALHEDQKCLSDSVYFYRVTHPLPPLSPARSPTRCQVMSCEIHFKKEWQRGAESQRPNSGNHPFSAPPPDRPHPSPSSFQQPHSDSRHSCCVRTL